MWASYPGREDPLKDGTATHSSVLAWEIPWTEEPGGIGSWSKELDTTEHTHNNHSIGESQESRATQQDAQALP